MPVPHAALCCTQDEPQRLGDRRSWPLTVRHSLCTAAAHGVRRAGFRPAGISAVLTVPMCGHSATWTEQRTAFAAAHAARVGI